MSSGSGPAVVGKVAGGAPGWLPAAFLFGLVSIVFRFNSVWSWWALLWAPVFAIAVGMMVHEWRLTIRSHWRMPMGEWGLFVAAHAGCAAALGVMLGLLHY